MKMPDLLKRASQMALPFAIGLVIAPSLASAQSNSNAQAHITSGEAAMALAVKQPVYNIDDTDGKANGILEQIGYLNRNSNDAPTNYADEKQIEKILKDSGQDDLRYVLKAVKVILQFTKAVAEKSDKPLEDKFVKAFLEEDCKDPKTLSMFLSVNYYYGKLISKRYYNQFYDRHNNGEYNLSVAAETLCWVMLHDSRNTLSQIVDRATDLKSSYFPLDKNMDKPVMSRGLRDAYNFNKMKDPKNIEHWKSELTYFFPKIDFRTPPPVAINIPGPGGD